MSRWYIVERSRQLYLFHIHLSNSIAKVKDSIWYELCIQEEFEDTTGVIRVRKSKKNRQPNDQMKRDKETNNDLFTNKTKDRVTRTPTKNRGELRCSGCVGSSRSASGTRRVTLGIWVMYSRLKDLFIQLIYNTLNLSTFAMYFPSHIK